MNDDLPETARIALATVAAYRAAARRAVHADRSLKVRCLALLRLAEAGRAEPDPTLASWVESAIWREAAPLLTGRPASLAGDAHERGVRRLRSRGYVMCPSCRTPLPTEEILDRWRLIRTQGVANA